MTCYNPENFKNYYPPTRLKKIGVAFETVRIPASVGDSKTYPPKLGLYTNKIVKYEADDTVWLYDSLSNYTQVDDGGGSSSVVSVNGKTGVVVLKTSDLENDSNYVNGTFVENAISEEATTREGEDERIEGKVDDVADDLEAEVAARSDADRQLSTAIGDETTARQGADNNLQSQIDAITASSDVTDIVGTYAELQAYDTSTLGDRDIIKVLQDESRDDETTYYRWSTTTQTFTLIGEEGPYYTKAAADTKFQDKLTAGANITISANNEISATDTTYSDFTGTDGVDPGTSGLVPAPATTDAGKFLKSDGTWDTAGSTINVVQTTGTSTADVMSQNATTSMIYEDPATKEKIRIGAGANAAIGGYAIGYNARTNNGRQIAFGAYTFTGPAASESIAIGHYACAYDGAEYSVALGAGSQVTRKGQVDISCSMSEYTTSGYNNSSYRLISGVYDGQSDHDAATYGQVISYAAINNAGAPTTATEAKYIGQLYYDTTNSDLYYCSAITPQGTDPETYEYTWTVVGGGPTVVQTTGTSQTDVMSQVATSQMIYPAGYETSKTRIVAGYNSSIGSSGGVISFGKKCSANGAGAIAIGLEATATGSGAMVIGYYGTQKPTATGTGALALGMDAKSMNTGNIAIGSGAQANLSFSETSIGRDAVVAEKGSVALGAYSRTSRESEVSVGYPSASDTSYRYRYLANVKDPSLPQDAATKNYVDTKAIGTDETYAIADTDWTALSASSPYTYSADVTATYTIGANTIVELINDNPVLFSTYGFAIGAVSSQTVTIYSVGAPSSSVSLTINYKG